MRNPEFQRNLWLEITAQRLIAMPVILGLWLVLLMLDIGGRATVVEAVQTSFLVAFVIIVVLWGAARAARSVVSELTSGTWDQQRMSAISPWAMSWGKLFGSTAYTWYGGAFCLAVYLLVPPWLDSSVEMNEPAMVAGLLVAAGVLFQASSLFLVLISSRRDRARTSSHRAVVWAPALLLYLLVWPFTLMLDDEGLVGWYGSDYEPLSFALVSSVAFAVWAILGTYRQMRTELQFRNEPWVWLAFVLFLMGYVAGFIQRPEFTSEGLFLTRLAFAFMLCVGLVYLTAFTEPKDPTRARRLASLWREGRVRRFLQDAPTWVFTAFLALLVLAVLLVMPAETGPLREGWGKSVYLAMFLFLLRDIGLLLGFNLARNPRRADVAVLVYLVVLYTVLPGIFSIFDAPLATAFFWPWAGEDAASRLLPVACQLVLMAWWVGVRWDRYETSLEGRSIEWTRLSL